mgnify:CR=1 FL=1
MSTGTERTVAIIIMGACGFIWGFGPYRGLNSCTRSTSDNTDVGEEYVLDVKSTRQSCGNCVNGTVYDSYGNAYICSQCGGTGYVTGSATSGVSFTGRGITCRGHQCECTIKRSELDAGNVIRCGCGHITSWHHE